MLKPPVSDVDHQIGPSSAPIVLLEYGDYACPYCIEAYPVIEKIKENMGDSMLFVFRYFPLEAVHPNANKAALAAEAASKQREFWKMHNLLYSNQNKLEWNDILGMAKNIGLDLQKFEIDFKSQILQDKIDDDLESGLRSGVNGTPSFFINGEKYNGDWAYEEFLVFLKNKI
jgi:protein-disulfide isomerase